MMEKFDGKFSRFGTITPTWQTQTDGRTDTARQQIPRYP